MARKLRIAVSVFFGLLTVKMCMLWVRSFYWYDLVRVPLFNSGGISVASLTGQICFMQSVSLWPTVLTIGGELGRWNGT